MPRLFLSTLVDGSSVPVAGPRIEERNTSGERVVEQPNNVQGRKCRFCAKAISVPDSLPVGGLSQVGVASVLCWADRNGLLCCTSSSRGLMGDVLRICG